MWKLHEIGDVGVYNNLRYDRIRFPETNKGEPDLTPYIDPKSKYADIGVGFQMDANWDEILGVLGFDAERHSEGRSSMAASKSTRIAVLGAVSAVICCAITGYPLTFSAVLVPAMIGWVIGGILEKPKTD